MAQLPRSFATNCRTKCYFSCACQGRQQLMPLNSWVYSITKHQRDVNVSQTCVSFEKKLILARIGLLGDYEGRNFKICLQYRAQLGMRFRPNKNRRRKDQGEVNLKMAEEYLVLSARTLLQIQLRDSLVVAEQTRRSLNWKMKSTIVQQMMVIS